MKLIKSLSTALACFAMASAAFAQQTVDSVKHSQGKAIPDTSSVVCTEAQDMNPSLTALEFSKQMGNGINLGNTMEAYRPGNVGTDRAATYYEQLWGQPVTTEKLMQTYKKSGFDTIRIPVAWTNAMEFENGDYTINPKYLDRVETIVNWALKSGLTVVLNDHWDGGWWGMFGQKDFEKDAWALHEAMWTQIAVRFKNYGYNLIFEGGNEELGDRLNDAINGVKGTLNENQCYEMTNKINQKFVDIVRGTGGNNACRFLLIPGYDTNISKTCDSRYKMPKDTVNERLFVSVHYYDPSNFCLADGDLWGTQKDFAEQNASFEKMLQFTDEGYGVIIGEYGALPASDGSKKNATDAWTTNVLNNCDANNYVPCLWDCNGFFKKSGKLGIADKSLKSLFASRSRAGQKEEKVGYDKIVNKALDALDDAILMAPKVLSDNKLAKVSSSGGSVAWIMYTSSNWQTTYSVGDVYNPDSKTKGLIASDVEITGEGDYTIGIDFRGTGAKRSSGFAFSAIGISNGEINYPGWCITITKVTVNGKEVPITKKNYTSSDDKKTTRSNLYNEWVPNPRSVSDAHVADGDLTGISATPFPKQGDPWNSMETLEIQFHYGPANN